MKIGFYGGKFLPLHMGHISCIIQSSNMCDKLYVGISYSNIRDAELFNGRLKYIPLQKRIEWLKQVAIPLKNVEVFSFEDGDGIDYISWEDGAKQIMNHIGENVDCVFGSEPSYREVFKKYYPHAKYIMLDHNRKEYPISATEIRLEGVFKHWEYIPNICKPYYNKKIVVVGTESCGKSMLVEKLAMKGISVKAYDPEALEETARWLKGRKLDISLQDDMYGILEGADALMIATEWDCFKNSDISEIAARLRGNLIFDYRNILEPGEVSKAGLNYYGVGRRYEID